VGAFDLVHATAPPYSAFLAGRLAGLLGTPWIADFRDGWTCCPTRADLPRWRRNLEHRMEVGVLTSADRVLFASPGVRERYVREISGLAERSETLLTGFDAPGFSQECGASGRSPRLELLHVGSVFLMRRERTLQKFLEGLGLWMASAPGDRTRIRVRFLGAEPAVAEMVASAGLAEVVECLPSVPRSGLATELRGADAALVLQPPGPLGGDPIPGKLFDATGAGCPLLLMGTEGALPGLVRRLDLGPVVDPADPGGIARALDQASERVRAGEPVHRLPASSLRALSSESFAARIVEISEELTSPGGARCPSPSVS
jgi:glycosyltransferase involved in cell wall biosynthesis